MQLPPLRERKEDIMDFVWLFIKKANKDFDRNITNVDNSAKELLENYYWYGNIRELQNVINRIVLLSPIDTILPELLPDEIRFHSVNSAYKSDVNDVHNVSDLKSATLNTEREIIHNALIKTNNNKSRAAKLLKIDRKTLYYKIKRYDLKA